MNSRHVFPIRVYYEDTDFSGNVYHASYLRFMERGRTEFLRDEGIHHSELARNGIAFAVRSMQIDFLAAAHIDDLLAVATTLEAVTGARLTLQQSIARAGLELARAKVVIVAITSEGRATRMPRALLDRFRT